MKKGSQEDPEEAKELAKKSEDERLLLCARDLMDALPNEKLEEPKQTDTEEAVQKKLMMQVKFESKMFAVQKKYGQEIMQKVLDASKGEGTIPKALDGSAELAKLMEKLRMVGLLEEPAAVGSKPTGPPASLAPPT